MRTDTLIIGSGIAGATAALRLADNPGHRVTVITREADPTESNSDWAQGGIVGRGANDTAELLAEDILRTGAGLSSPPAVRLLAEEGPRLLRELLIDAGGPSFDRDESGEPAFGLEGAHSRRRILHVGDSTGHAIMTRLIERLAERPQIELLTGRTAVDLITYPHHARDPLRVYDEPTCQGAYVLDTAAGVVEPILARQTILATGGLGQIFLNSSNPPGTRGDGLAMAHRAGARVVNAEYVQFHPTTLHLPGPTKFLISEAVRGEGARLLTPQGEPFMERYSARWKDLAPRDIVARAIYWEMLEHDLPHVMLDLASHRPAEFIRERFPQIYERCKARGLDITQQPIPVVPAAHYFCGGVLVDLWGRTTLPRLYAVGEVACTGVHGANRLASTSLLEGLVWGARAAQSIDESAREPAVDETAVPPWDVSDLRFDPDPALVQGDMQTIRTLMWHYVGLVRNEHRLTRAIRELTHLALSIEDFYRRARLTDGLIGLRNAIQVALLVARSAHHNRTSRGCHYREDTRAEAPDPPAPSGGRRSAVEVPPGG
ncbi:MAG TPA: L-aspartate oxidase [Candidatus Polarisedimenticolaceae bacterium]|nr:L-aspartate oxidase [Candidatus Polarisedimenticolaceae bacterium]